MFELDCRFSSFEEWISWTRENVIYIDSPKIYKLGARIKSQGFTEPLTRHAVKSGDILSDISAGLREGLVAFGRISRTRAVLLLIEAILKGRDRTEVKIYAPEAVTSFALCLRGIYPRFLGSEYAPTQETQDYWYPIPHQDLTCLTLPSGTFDLVTTNEVLEHVPNIDAALTEICRVLKPGGWHIGTHPFAFMNATGILRAEMKDGKVKFKTEPEYHGNPVGEPSLVFEIPGWDILARARQAGFSNAHMRFVASESHGFCSENMGIFVLCCQK